MKVALKHTRRMRAPYLYAVVRVSESKQSATRLASLRMAPVRAFTDSRISVSKTSATERKTSPEVAVVDMASVQSRAAVCDR